MQLFKPFSLLALLCLCLVPARAQNYPSYRSDYLWVTVPADDLLCRLERADLP